MFGCGETQVVAIWPKRIATPPIYLIYIHARSLEVLSQLFHWAVALEQDCSSVLDVLLFLVEAESQPQLVVPDMVILCILIKQIVQKLTFCVVDAHAAAGFRKRL